MSNRFRPAWLLVLAGNALFFQALIQGAAIFQQREDVRLLIADVDGLRRFGYKRCLLPYAKR
jgi:hypothetical protein